MNKDTFNAIFGELLANEKHYFNALFMQPRIYILGKLVGQIKQQFRCLFTHNISLKEKNIILCITLNQSRTTLPLSNTKNVIVRPYLDAPRIDGVDTIVFPSLRYISEAFKCYRWLTNSKKLPLGARLYLSIAYYYYYDAFFQLFSKDLPNSVTMTNPSHPILRSAIQAAKDLGVKTVYMPHAHPSRLYPCINTDFALLEGKDGLNYYTFDNKCQRFLVGAIRLDSYKRIRPKNHQGMNVLVATNLLDDMSKVKQLLREISEVCPNNCNIFLRPHPYQIITEEEYRTIPNLSFSNSRMESCLDALLRSDILIAGNTTTFFEAIYLPIKCFYYDFIKEGNIKDSYELLTYSFIHKMESVSQLFDKTITNDRTDLERVDYSYGRFDSSLSEILKFYSKL